jgi:hypothetical protein
MFGIARVLVRNKVLVIGVIAVGAFFMSGQKEEPKPSSPWAVAPAAPVQGGGAAGSSFTDKAFKAADSAAKMAGMEDYAPSQLRDQTVGNLEKAGGAIDGAGKN